MSYRLLFDQVLTRTNPEHAHHAAFAAIKAARPVTSVAWPRISDPVEAMGITFPNRLGLAAGFDKNAVGPDALGNLGFGHVEIGTVTGRPQPGNPTPRLMRLPQDHAVINRMGFNNDGAEVVAQRLARRRARSAHRRTVLGVNIGKTKVVEAADAVADYEFSAGLLAPYADYLVVNVSSPNTPGLRDLQAVGTLEPLLLAVRRAAEQSRRDSAVPLLVKIAPDLADDDVVAVADLALALGLDGIIATNTTIGRSGLVTDPTTVEAAGAGGLSGPPVRERACEVMRLLRERVGDDMCLIGVGGITTVEDAHERIEAGATLVQGYTAFIYEGPLWPLRIAQGLKG